MNLHINNKIHIDDKDVVYNLYRNICKTMNNLHYTHDRELVIVCIGTDRCTGDSLGPFIGKYLKENNVFNVYGTIDNPVHGSNIGDYILKIKRKYNDPLIIAIDSGLGEKKSIGNIQINKGAIKPGIGVDKNLPEVGDIKIKGMVNISNDDKQLNYMILLSTRLSLVLKQAKIINYALENVVNRFNKINNTYEKVAIGEGN